MARIWKPVLGLAVLLLAAGCGGSGKSAATSASTAVTVPTATVTTPDKGLTPAQWKRYQGGAAAFTATNAATLAKVESCAKQAGEHAGAVQTCIGASVKRLVAVTTVLGATLAAVANSVGGSCQSHLAALIGYVVPYQASLASLQKTIAKADAAAVIRSVSSLQAKQDGGRAASAGVAGACAPS